MKKKIDPTLPCLEVTGTCEPTGNLTYLEGYIDSQLAFATRTINDFKQAKREQNPSLIDDDPQSRPVTLKRVSKYFTQMNNGLGSFDRLITHWKTQQLKTEHLKEIERFRRKIDKLHSMNIAILTLIKDLQA